jgi:hypothetical protein
VIMTEEAQRSLTDSECVSMLGGTIGTLLQVASPDRVERAIRTLRSGFASLPTSRSAVASASMPERLGKDAEPHADREVPIELDSRPRRAMTDNECICMLGGTVGALLQLASSTEVERAIQWWVEHPESLVHILSLTRSTLAFNSKGLRHD